MSYEFVEVIRAAFADLWASLLMFLPRFLGAIIVLVVGLFIASALGKLITKLCAMLHLDELATKLDVKQTFERAGVRLHIGHLFGWIVKWFFVAMFLIASADILRWTAVTAFLRDVVLYLPNVIIGVVILLVGVILANFVRNLVQTAVEAAHLSSGAFLSGVAKWSILVFSFMAALVQLGIAQNLIQVLFTGLVAMLALAGGLAFGLGGRDQAARALEHLRKDISER